MMEVFRAKLSWQEVIANTSKEERKQKSTSRLLGVKGRGEFCRECMEQ